jgi:hypothetical protein
MGKVMVVVSAVIITKPVQRGQEPVDVPSCEFSETIALKELMIKSQSPVSGKYS